MSYQSEAKQLIAELLKLPETFTKEGKAYQLLQCYFNGVDLDTLRPLLSNEHALVRRAAAFIASELGSEAKSLVGDVVSLIDDLDPHTQWCALESVMVCSHGEVAANFVAVVRELENKRSSIRQLAMRLVSNASVEQLDAGLTASFRIGKDAEIHARGLHGLLAGSVDVVLGMIDDSNVLISKYGAIGAKRLFSTAPQLLRHASEHPNPDVRRFSEDALSDAR